MSRPNYEDIGGTEMPVAYVRGLDCPKCGAALDISTGDADGASSDETLRDRFAMAALASFGLGLAGMNSHTVAELAYDVADAMLTARK
jgi:hypothetical protein